MNVYTTIDNVATKIKDIATPYKLEDSEIRAQILAAVKDYSKRRPMKKRHTFEIETDEAVYDLPADFIHAIYVPTEGKYLSPDGKVRFTAAGLVPSGGFDLPEEYMIQGAEIEFRPTPQTTFDADMIYAAAHVLDDEGEAFATIPVIDEDLVELKSAIGCLETLLSQMARDNFKYTTGTTTIDKSGQARDMKIILDRWGADYDNRMLRAAGARG